jgi:hypothetical protein
LPIQEARRLMLGEDLDVASASFRIGYSAKLQHKFKRGLG